MVPFSVEKQKTSDGVKVFGMRLLPQNNGKLSTEGNGTVSQSVYTTASSTHHYIQIELESASSTISTVNIRRYGFNEDVITYWHITR